MVREQAERGGRKEAISSNLGSSLVAQSCDERRGAVLEAVQLRCDAIAPQVHERERAGAPHCGVRVRHPIFENNFFVFK